MEDRRLVVPDVWRSLRERSPARIALGRAGGSLPTAEWLAFKGDHAAARDAVHAPFNADAVARDAERLGFGAVVVASRAAEGDEYLLRPDLGRRLDDASRERLRAMAASVAPPDLAVVVSGGLSALAAHEHAVALLATMLPRLAAQGWQVAPVVVARGARVALQDEVGEMLGAKLALIALGERPGLRAADSLGVYFVRTPRVGNTDAQRNCVSNIRRGGLSPQGAAQTLQHLLEESLRRGLSGVELKDLRSLRPTIPSGG